MSVGGTGDIVGRLLAQEISAKTGKAIIVSVQTGGLGLIAPQTVVRSEPDGHTLALMFASPMTFLPFMKDPPPYDALKDFEPVIGIYKNPIMFFAAPSMPAKTMTELIALAKANPAQVKIGYAGSAARAFLLMLSSASGAKFLLVPYRSGLPPPLLAGEVDVIVDQPGTMIPLVKDGKAKAIGTGGLRRNGVFPEAPVIADTVAGMEGIEMGSWLAVLAPAGTPSDRIQWLNREFNTALQSSQKARDQITSAGYETLGGTPHDFAMVLKNDTTVASQIVKKFNLKMD